jgi:hypothetical protein
MAVVAELANQLAELRRKRMTTSQDMGVALDFKVFWSIFDKHNTQGERKQSNKSVIQDSERRVWTSLHVAVLYSVVRLVHPNTRLLRKKAYQNANPHTWHPHPLEWAGILHYRA